MLLLLVLILSLLHPSHSSHYLKLPLLRRTPFPSAATLPVTSGASSGSGQYFVSILLGTPPQSVLLVADTGSDLIWVACSACRDCSRHVPRSSLFPRLSSSFAPHHCFSPKCNLISNPIDAPHCPHTRLHSPCFYEYSYADGSRTSGIFSTETTTFNTSTGKVVKLPGLAFGCGFNNSVPSINGANGVLGLGRGPTSFVSQMGPRFGNKFSYCLRDYTLSPTPTSFLLIGGTYKKVMAADQGNKTKMHYTPLQTNPLSPTFYYVGIRSVYIDGVKLTLRPSVWDMDKLGNKGTIVDSGTTLTFLPEVAYDLILKEFIHRVRLPVLDEPTLGFDLCLNMSGKPRPRLPRLSFRVVGGSIFSPPPNNYFIDTEDSVKCLALQPVSTPEAFAVIGNLMQQGYLFEFDMDRSRLGFTRHSCGSP